jgi:hypothetical protein
LKQNQFVSMCGQNTNMPTSETIKNYKMHEPRNTLLCKLSSHGSIILYYSLLSFFHHQNSGYISCFSSPSCISAIIASYIINPMTMHKLQPSSLTLDLEVTKYLHGAQPIFVSLTVDQLLKKFPTSYGIL